jgi:hypothetical protein
MKILKQLALFAFFLLLASCEKWELDADCSEGIPNTLNPFVQENILIYKLVKLDDWNLKWEISDEESETIWKTSFEDSLIIDKNITPNGNYKVKVLIETSCGLSHELISDFSNQESWFPNMVKMESLNCPREYSQGINYVSSIDLIFSSLRNYSISEMEITNEVFNEVMYGDKYNSPGNSFNSECLQCPKITSFVEATLFCNKLSSYAGKAPVYYYLHNPRDVEHFNIGDIITLNSSNGYRIPTRLEWEKAAFGCPENNIYSFFGLNYSAEYGNISLLEPKTKTEPVGSYKTNNSVYDKNKIYDMVGNVSEWISEDDNGLFSRSLRTQFSKPSVRRT